MKDTQYKFKYIIRDDDVFITEIAVSFFEGTYTASKEMRHPITGAVIGNEPHFDFERKLHPTELGHLKTTKAKQSLQNDQVYMVYDASDFGAISTQEELIDFLDDEIIKDTSRKPIPDQNKKLKRAK